MGDSETLKRLELHLLQVDGAAEETNFSQLKSNVDELYECIPSLKIYLDNNCIEVIEKSELAKDLIAILDNFNTETDSYEDFENSCITSVGKHNPTAGQSTDRIQYEADLLLLACSFLKLFTQVNWTGPAIQDLKRINSICMNKKLGEFLIDSFNDRRGGFSGVGENYTFLWIAALILIKGQKYFKEFQLTEIWVVKVLYLFQEVLDDASPILQSLFANVCEENNLARIDSIMGNTQLAAFYQECMYLSIKFYDYGKAKVFLEKSQTALKIDISLSGVLGMRTRFQEKELAQLKLFVNKSSADSSTAQEGACSSQYLPKDIALDNDILLPEIKYKTDETVTDITTSEQALIVSMCSYLRKTKPRDSLTPEELTPYAEYVVKSPKSWAVQSRALHLRSLLECHSSRKVERAMTQMEELVASYGAEKPEAKLRMKLLGSVGLPPRWVYEKELGRLLMSLGCTKSALETFLRIQEWNDVIQCYTSLGSREKAKGVIKEQLAVKETPKLWCLLGNVTDDIDCFNKAWELSGKKYAKAQGALGFWYLKDGKLQECIPCFEKSLELNYLQPSVWFALGFAAMNTQNYATAAKAYQSAVTVDPDNFESWSNLSSAFIRTGQKEKAFRALKEAIRLNYESWKVWENYSLVATDIGEFQEVILASNRLLDLKPKHVDSEVLSILCKAVLQDLNDMHGEPASRLLPALKKLFGRITSQVTSNSEVWTLYADIYSPSETPENKYKVYQYMMKAVKCKIDAEKWKKDQSDTSALVSLCQRLAIVAAELVEESGYESQRNQILTSPRLLISNLVLRLKEKYQDECSHVADLEKCVKDLE